MVTCLTRDSYLTHRFLQHLMAVLSLLERTPSPEPVDRDFYSEFGNKTAGTPPSSGLLPTLRAVAGPRTASLRPSSLSAPSSLFLLSQLEFPMVWGFFWLSGCHGSLLLHAGFLWLW